MMIDFALEAERNHGKKPDEESGHCNTNWNRMDADSAKSPQRIFCETFRMSKESSGTEML